MGRAIAMEKQLDEFKERIKIVEDALSTVIDVVESMQDKGQRTTHVDLVDEVKDEDWDPNEIAVEAQKMMEEGAEKHVKEKAKKKKSSEKAKQSKKD